MSIEREGDVVRPSGDATVQPGDLVTVIPRGLSREVVIDQFVGPGEGDTEVSESTPVD